MEDIKTEHGKPRPPVYYIQITGRIMFRGKQPPELIKKCKKDVEDLLVQHSKESNKAYPPSVVTMITNNDNILLQNVIIASCNNDKESLAALLYLAEPENTSFLVLIEVKEEK